jgi:hypothetical protein
MFVIYIVSGSVKKITKNVKNYLEFFVMKNNYIGEVIDMTSLVYFNELVINLV